MGEILLWTFLLTLNPQGKELPGIATAHRLWQTGKYEQALEAYEALLHKPAAWTPGGLAQVALGRSECLASEGKAEQAIAALARVAAWQPGNASLWARLADLQFGRGQWNAAEASTLRALKADPGHLAARWVQARLFEARGKREVANDAWKWFVDHYNANQGAFAKNAEALLIVGQAAERYYMANARGEELKDQLVDVISELYEGALRADSACWQAPWLVGNLYLEGYNEKDALPELQRALTINPRAAEVLVSLGQADLQSYKLAPGRSKAERALEINPNFGPAHVLLADLNISDERFTDALAASKKAVAANPKDEEALARLAASCRLLVDPAGEWAAEAAALAVNPHPALFYAALGERLSDRRKYHSAERALLLAVNADPNRADARIGLGKLYMEIGREAEAADLFDAAFAADPFNVRADNWMKVLKHMASYAPIETEHYRVTFDPKQDALLGKYMARFLESIYKELTDRFGYAPPALTQVEIMDNHMWFSGRTVGLRFIPTVGACTGKVVALASPRATQKPFNWSRVLKHEITHVITLQQTDFNIPHWYTEALAVESEGTPRPQPWNKLLVERVPARSKLLNLDTINLGFIRPKEPDDRQLAYCQAQLYARYMLKRFGEGSLARLLDAYRRGLTTDRAIKDCFAVDKADFEAKYLDYLDEVVKTIRTRVADEKPVPFSQLERMVREKPDDADLNARMAYEHFARRSYREARPFADKALKLKPNHPLASYVKARLFVSIDDDDAALALLKPALDPENPNERVIDLLAELEMKAGRLDEAERLYELARKDDPVHTKWIAGLARVHLRQGNQGKLLADLAMIADNDADALDVRKTLAERHLKAGEPDKAAHWATECLYIDVFDSSNHALLADALLAEKKFAPAAEEYETALELKPKRPNDLKVHLARAQAGLGERAKARTTVESVLKRDPEHPEAKALLEELKAAKDE
ncbi:MAG TPA: tetratricopeptide repeat protein [Isosphaeraceae bacterium]|nr:tetratricopeptide repeat protein [Isosphaeraceae bacterium]